MRNDRSLLKMYQFNKQKLRFLCSSKSIDKNVIHISKYFYPYIKKKRIHVCTYISTTNTCTSMFYLLFTQFLNLFLLYSVLYTVVICVLVKENVLIAYNIL